VKLVVQIPCLNEEATLPSVLETIPIEIPGIDEIVVLVIDDGCTDRTVEVAREHGVTEFVHHTRNQGLGRSFHDGVVRALELGADIVVNTDGDNQYPQDRIADLVQPVVHGEADIVIADRQVDRVEHFSPLKKQLQKAGSAVVNRAAGTRLPDAASGFRAYSRESLILLNTVTRFSYCMETIIQAGNKNLKIASIPVRRGDRALVHHVQAVRHLRVADHLLRSPRPDPIRPVRRPVGRRQAGRPPPVAPPRGTAADRRGAVHHARCHLRPDPDQPGADRGQPRTH
jgi:glycosyltransferase involved in cell wall biosynthesis